MRLWSLHPALLDTRGLVALWREGLLARKVLLGKTVGYRSHPQLDRFRACARPLHAIDAYLWAVVAEATSRGYAFDATKLGPRRRHVRIAVTAGQIAHERIHLLRKLRVRFPAGASRLRAAAVCLPHPLFRVVAGPIASWERDFRAARTARRAADTARRRRSSWTVPRR
jgi:hypothetical protein